jgi:protein-disulfide isomerase
MPAAAAAAIANVTATGAARLLSASRARRRDHSGNSPMPSLQRSVAAFLFALLLLIVAAPAFAQPASKAGGFSKEEEAQIRAIVRDYLVNNPEVLEEAQKALQAKRDAEARKKQAEIGKSITADQRLMAFGPANAAITLIEFYDYNCPYCKVSVTWMSKLVRDRKDVRVIFVDFPILGPTSQEAAMAAVASAKQGKSLQFHQEMMATKGRLTSDAINQAARKVGMDVSRLRRDMNDPAIAKLLDDNRARAIAAGVEGTPTFMLNGELQSFGDERELTAALNAAKAGPKRSR